VKSYPTLVQLADAPAVGLIEILDGLAVEARCSFFFISYRTLITAKHCIPEDEFTYHMWLVRPDGHAVSVHGSYLHVIETNLETDVAVGTLQITWPDGFHPVRLSTRRLDSVRRLGIPIFDRTSMTMRYETCEFRLNWRDGGDIFYGCNVHAGASGAPIFDMDSGLVVGMHYAEDSSGGYSRGVESREIIVRSIALRDVYEVPEGCFEVARLETLLCD
jgi:V8-like Glu-specific endopeptidase